MNINVATTSTELQFISGRVTKKGPSDLIERHGTQVSAIRRIDQRKSAK